jgi:simple sugar transport system permease protein
MKLPITRKHIPLLATAVVLAFLFGTASVLYDGFFSLRVVTNLFYDNAFLGITALGMTFVILSGGIDLSVGAVIGFTTIFVGTMIADYDMAPPLAWLLAIFLGTAMGMVMGLLIQAYDMPPFLVTLGGMFFARGMAFVVNMESVAIAHPTYDRILAFGVPLARGVVIPAITFVFLAVFLLTLYLAHYSRFGRVVYAIGGSEQSAVLMGLPTARTKVLVYTFNGLCSALAGIVMTMYMGSGNPIIGVGMELDAIACVVIGGTLLTGGVGYVAGTVLGVLIFGTIQSALNFDGRLNSWWLRIAIGLLLLAFILLQKVLSRTSAEQPA